MDMGIFQHSTLQKYFAQITQLMNGNVGPLLDLRLRYVYLQSQILNENSVLPLLGREVISRK